MLSHVVPANEIEACPSFQREDTSEKTRRTPGPSCHGQDKDEQKGAPDHLLQLTCQEEGWGTLTDTTTLNLQCPCQVLGDQRGISTNPTNCLKEEYWSGPVQLCSYSYWAQDSSLQKDSDFFL